MVDILIPIKFTDVYGAFSLSRRHHAISVVLRHSNVLVKMLCRALERGDDVADVDLLAHAGLSGDRLQRAFEPSHHFARPFPAAGLVHEARKAAQLRLAADRMMEA